jgi:hypothetical protein
MTIVNKKKDGTWSRMTSNAETVPCRGIGIKGDGSTIQHNTAQAKSTHSQAARRPAAWVRIHMRGQP